MRSCKLWPIHASSFSIKGQNVRIGSCFRQIVVELVKFFLYIISILGNNPALFSITMGFPNHFVLKFIFSNGSIVFHPYIAQIFSAVVGRKGARRMVMEKMDWEMAVSTSPSRFSFFCLAKVQGASESM